MKKIGFTLILLHSLFCLTAQTDYVTPQPALRNKFDLGAHIGPNYSFLYGSDYVVNTSAPVNYFSGGILAQYNFPKTISIITGLYYDKKGYRIDELYGYNNANIPLIIRIKQSYNYLSIPLMIKASFGRKINFFINAGGYAAFLLSSVDKINYSDHPTVTKKNNVTAGYNLVDFGLTTGIGLNIPLDKMLAFSIEFRNNTGLSDIGKLTITHPIKTNSTSILFGLIYRLGSKTN